jgi:predicted DNA-binding transcriptional regulator AlpA
MAAKSSISSIDPIREFDSLPNSARVDVKCVAVLYGMTESTIYRKLKKGLIPQPVRNDGCTRWRVGDLRQHLQASGS